MIGIFDSGVGGLSVWKELYSIMPNNDYIYIADSAYCPYGCKSVDDIIFRACKITDFLIDIGCSIIVVACNTATAAAIDYLRRNYASKFVGMEPAVKPAALKSQSGVIGVLATAGTFRGSLYLHTLTKFAKNVRVIEQIGDGLVELVEAGKADSGEADTLLRQFINPMLNAGADHIVLGCTHYPFLENGIQKIAGNRAVVVNPAPAVALRTRNILYETGNKNYNENGKCTFISTGNLDTMKTIVKSVNHKFTDNNFFTETI